MRRGPRERIARAPVEALGGLGTCAAAGRPGPPMDRSAGDTTAEALARVRPDLLARHTDRWAGEPTDEIPARDRLGRFLGRTDRSAGSTMTDRSMITLHTTPWPYE